MTTPDVRPLLKKALLRIEVLEETAARREAEKTEPIAIIGVACRFPGGGTNPEAFWQALDKGVDAVRRTSEERWAGASIPGRELDIQWASLLDDVYGFDAPFFGISPREAVHLDPQQRLVLEVASEALESAGLDVLRLKGSKTGVFLGQSSNDYAFLLNDNRALDMYGATGTTLSTSAGRVAFSFGFQGPCLVLDTACSSSLVTTHIACQSLRQKDCDLALAGGVNLILHPFTTATCILMKTLSPDGRCKTFDARANGFVRGEGCGMLTLKRLSDAERDGDPIFAVIRGSAINHDGRATGLTAPNMLAQRAMLRAALENARLQPEDIGYVETHGTGTSLGDPIEFEALQHVLGQPRADGSKCVLGAVKTNIGHLEAAAGVAGLIKVIGALRKGKIPKNLNFETLNPHISIAGTPFAIPTEAVPFISKDKPRRAGVSSFGLSGTNAHVIVEEAPRREDKPFQQASSYLLPLSAKSPEALAAMAKSYQEWLSSHDEPLHHVAYTASLRRSHLEHRLSVIGTNKGEIAATLAAFVAGDNPSNVVTGKSGPSAPKVVFVFPGQGSQWVGMGRQLYREEPIFRDALDACNEAIRKEAGFSIVDELGKPEETSRIYETLVAQPTLFAIEVALSALLQSWGIKPAAVIGHSVGEIAAAHVAGMLELAQAARLVCVRARVMQKATGFGKMISVSLDEQAATNVIAGLEDRVGIAAINDPNSVVLSGDIEVIDSLVEKLTQQGVQTRPLRVNYAFHSPQMEPLLTEFKQALGELAGKPGSIPMLSTVTGNAVSDNLDATYWARNIRQAVRFADALVASAENVFVEVGPHPVLSLSMEQTMVAKNISGHVIPTLRREKDERKQALLALGALHVHGLEVDWKRFYPNGGRVVALATYPWQRQRYWIDLTRKTTDARDLGLSLAEHPLLGGITALADSDGFLLTGRLSLSEQPWLADHAVFDTVLVPGTGILELALAGARRVGQTSLSELTLEAPLLLPRRGGVRIQLVIQAADGAGRRVLSLFSQADDAAADAPWTRNATGVLGENDSVKSDVNLEVWPPAGALSVELGDFYPRLAARGYQYGPAFQGLTEVWRRGNEVFARAMLPESLRKNAGDYGMHPALLDAALHALFLAGGTDSETIQLPFAFSDAALEATGANELRIRFELPSLNTSEQTISLSIADGAGQPVAHIGALQVRPATETQIRSTMQSTERDLYRVDWTPIAASDPEKLPRSWVLGGDGRLAAKLGFEWISDIDAIVDKLNRNEPAPERLLMDFTTVIAWEVPLPEQVQRETARALATLQFLLAEKRLSKTSLTWVTRKTIATNLDDTVEDLARASLWGLIRSVRNENPDRLLKLIDLDDSIAPAALIAETSEPELVWRSGSAFAPRLNLVRDNKNPVAQPGMHEGTLLITGGTGELGQSLAKHLVRKYGAKHLLLTSRRGVNAPGAESFVTALKEAGAQTVTVAACDIANRADVATLIQSIPADKPLRAVFHLAGAIDDGLATALTEARLAHALRPKVAGAWNLHECTQGLELSAFVMFSSVAGVMGSAGQANYAAANTFLDALAAQRRRLGLAGQSFAWGFWEQQRFGMTAHLSAADLARLQRQGFAPISVDAGLALLDIALTRPEATLVPMRLNLSQMQETIGEQGTIPAILRGLVQPSLRRVGPTAVAAQALRQRLLGLSENDRRQTVLDLVRREIASVVGLAGADAVPADKPLQVLGLDSLMAVELRNRLSARVETTLPATLAFDYPTADAIAGLLLQKAFADLETAGSATTTAKSNLDEPIAIVGMGCRYPGGVVDPESFWHLLDEGRDGTSEMPSERWDVDALYDPNPEAIGKMMTRRGGFLRDIERFDPAYFGISPREATAMDPQQRLLLETSWEALEQAGIVPEELMGADMGVFVGLMYQDYATLVNHDLAALDGHVGTGSAGSIASGRISYQLGVKGPSLTVDTACSSSLVTVHLACQALRRGECSTALAGGVALMLTPATFVEFSRLRGLAPDGRSKSFSATADGVSWSEGCGMLVLERLSDAQRLGHRVLAVIRGSAVNQDGRSNGLTAPNGPSQQDVIRRALVQAGLRATHIDYVECHGTGTTLGDPIEVQALGAVMSEGRTHEHPAWIGSVKSNFGHTQSAAGAAGIMKIVLAMQHDRIPPSLHFDAPSPHIPWSELPVEVVSQSKPWIRNGKPRRAGVSSFGISGTNAHVILEEPPQRADKPIQEAMSYLLPLSAKTPKALAALANSYQEWLSSHDEPLHHVAHTASLRRSHLEHRLSVAGTNKAEITSALGAFIAGENPPNLVVGKKAQSAPSVVFVFPGQGSQWVGMGRQLYREEPVFRDALDACTAAIRKESGFSIVEELDKPDKTSRLHETIVAQPALFAMEVALSALLQSWGVKPSAVIGHSVGEIAAAHVAGMLDLAQAARLVCVRARVMQKATGHGKMVSVSLDEQAAAKAIAGLEDRIGIAAINDPHSVVLSGDIDVIDSIVAKLAQDGLQTRPLRVNYAFHSPQMEPLLPEFKDALGEVVGKPGNIPMFSTVTGRAVSDDLDATYWARNIRQAVRFADAVVAGGGNVFVEVGPHPVLSMSIEQTLHAKNIDNKVLPTLRREKDERKQALLALGALYAHGLAVDWKRFYPDGGRVVALPTYPWQRERYWFNTRPAAKRTVAGQVYDGFNTFLSLDGATDNDARWEMYLTFGPFRDIVSEFSWLDAALEKDLPPEYWQMSLNAQREMRRVLFRHVEFASCKRVLDFGCGYATDLMVLAKRHPHLQLDGYTISMAQAETDKQRVARAGLEQRVHIHHRDSAQDEFPAQYDLIFGFEVAHHIRDKNALFGNVGRHLVEGGALVLADFISNVAFEIEHEETSSFFLTKEQWVDVLSPHGLEIIDCVDISPEVANYLHEPDFDAKLNQASPSALNRYSRSALVSYDRLGKTLRKGWTSYVLLSVRKNSTLSKEELAERNQAALVQLISYEVANPGPARHPVEEWLFDVQWRRKESTHSTALTETRGSWIVVASCEATGAALVERLGQIEPESILVVTDGSYRQITPRVVALDASRVDDWVRFFAEHVRDAQRFAGIVDLSNLGTTPTNRTTTRTLTEDLARTSVTTTMLVQALARHGFRQSPRLYLVTRGAQSVLPDDAIAVAQAPILGLGKTIAMEHPELRCTRIDLAPGAGEFDVETLLQELRNPTPEDQIALRNAARYVARMARTRPARRNSPEKSRILEPAGGRPYRLEADRSGQVARLAHYEMVKPQPGPNDVLIAVEAGGLNFIDVLAVRNAISENVSGSEGQTLGLGHECAGRVVAVGEGVTNFVPGDGVLALGSTAFGTHCVLRSEHVVKKSSALTWEQAATLPISFLTAYYALEYLGRLRAGERVLIHAGTGGVGLAAIQWAQHIGAEIFATAGNDEKREYLRSIGVRHVFDSRSSEFVDGIQQITRGEGVDVVLNSLSGSLMTANFSVLAALGRFVEIGRNDSLEEQKAGRVPLVRNVSFARLDLMDLSSKRPAFVGRLLHEVAAFFDKGVFRPLPVQSFAFAQAQSAFEFMADAKHIGKTALRLTDESEPRIVPLHPVTLALVRPDATYLITGGLGGLGLSVANWLVEQGARHVVLVGRRPPTPDAQTAIAAMTNAGADIRVMSADISDENEVRRMLATIRDEMPALAGIIHAAAVLDDHTLLEQTSSSFHTVFAPKALGAWHLHVQTQSDKLDFFVMYSSAASLLGSPGQANYCAANAFLDALARERVRCGLPGMSIQWGAFSEVGLAAARDSRSARLANRGMTALTPADGLEALHRLLEHPRPEIGVLRLDIRQWVEFYPTATRLPFLTEITTPELTTERDSTLTQQTLEKLRSAPIKERSWLIEGHLADQIGFVLQLDPSRIDRLAPLQNLGLDSLMSLELRNRLEALLGVKLPATVTFTYPTMETLARHLLDQVGIEFVTNPIAETRTKPSNTDELAQLSDDELLRAGNEILA